MAAAHCRSRGRSLRALVALALVALVACEVHSNFESGPPKADPEVRSQLRAVQELACYRAATARGCVARASVSFGPRDAAREPGSEPTLRGGTLACVEGRPHGSFVAVDGARGESTVDGEIPEIVWESIWRVLDATDSCAAADGAPLHVTRAGATPACDAPTFDIGALIHAAYRAAKSGPPPADEPFLGSICDIDPEACGSRGSCPRFTGDYWSGVRRPARALDGAAPLPSRAP